MTTGGLYGGGTGSNGGGGPAGGLGALGPGDDRYSGNWRVQRCSNCSHEGSGKGGVGWGRAGWGGVSGWKGCQWAGVAP